MSQPKPKEKAVLLRLPENYILALDKIVENSKGRYRSRNDIVTELIGIFLSDLRAQAEKKVESRGKRL
jgi:hypothetical protein